MSVRRVTQEDADFMREVADRYEADAKAMEAIDGPTWDLNEKSWRATDIAQFIEAWLAVNGMRE